MTEVGCTVRSVSTQVLSPLDPRIEWRGATTVIHDGSTVEAFRLPGAARTVADSTLVERAWMPAGVRLRFRTDSDTIVVHSPSRGSAGPPDLPPVDLVVDGVDARSEPADDAGYFEFTSLGRGEKDVEIWLPQFGRFPLDEIRLDTDATATAPTPVSAHRLTVYGSSITQCRRAASPTQTWPALLARSAGWDLTCLGFGGECHLDPEAADAIVASKPDLVILCVGINIYSRASFTERTLAPAIRGFVASVRRGAPSARVIVCSPIASPDREEVANAIGMTLSDVRSVVEQTADDMHAADPLISGIDGRSILSEEDAHLLLDGLHPGPKGYRFMGERWSRVLAAL